MTIDTIRSDFPILNQTVHNHPLVYLDNAATTQKPQCVLDALTNYYREINANIHRGVYHLSEKATEAFENARCSVQAFINAQYAKECIFVKSTTEAINLVAQSYGECFVKENDEILISAMEHHSNIVPWQILCQRKGAHLKIIPINTKGELPIATLPQYFSKRTKLLAITHVSNVLGTLNPLRDIIKQAHAHHIPVLVDGAQSAPHLKIDVQDLDCDFFTFSGHKIYGPTGIGVLYGKTHWLEAIPPYQSGGEMILQVTFEKTTYKGIPFKFEAGTPAIAEAIALAKALEYLNTIGWKALTTHETLLLNYATKALSSIEGLTIIGAPNQRIGVLSFTMEGVHPHDIGTIVDQCGIAIRTGHHCAMPIMDFYAIPATARVSFGIYNTLAEIDCLINALQEVKKLFKL
jgi:cysteine desulfurase/selenocysteine lyase